MGRSALSTVDRFWSKVDIGQWDECWPWTAGLIKGYGSFYVGGPQTKVYAHRFAYEQLVGPIPDGLTIDHVVSWGCGRKDCVNPLHLETVTQGENVRRSDSPSGLNATKTHCPQGHAYTPENTYRDRHGWRRCQTCHATAQRRYSARLDAEQEARH